jgi:hypothetical protein
MNVEIWTEASQFLFGEYINRILFAVQGSKEVSDCWIVDENWLAGLVREA